MGRLEAPAGWIGQLAATMARVRYPIPAQRQDKKAPRRMKDFRGQVFDTYLRFSRGGTLRRHFGRRFVGKRRRGLRAVYVGIAWPPISNPGTSRIWRACIVNSHDAYRAWAIARPSA